jgi:hypothetical protein
MLLALGLLAAGLVFIAAEESAIARGTEDQLRARLAAESAVRGGLSGWRAVDYRGMATGASREIGAEVAGLPAGGTQSITVERLAGPLYLIRARAATAGGTMARAAGLVRGLEPAELWQAFPAALTTEGPLELWGEEAVAGLFAEPSAGGEPGAAGCLEAAVRELEIAFGDVERPALRAAGDGRRPALHLGPLDLTAVRQVADRYANSAVAPRPVEAAGRCDYDAVDNWGAPGSPGSPCADHFPLILAPGDLHFTDGIGQGILMVAGNLTMSGEASFHGAVVVAGGLHLRDQAKIIGAASIAPDGLSATLAHESRITYGACALLRAFTEAPALNRAFRPRDRGWIPQF